jgi:hypothetical protein
MVNGACAPVVVQVAHLYRGSIAIRDETSAPVNPVKQGGTAWRPLVPAGGLCYVNFIST